MLESSKVWNVKNLEDWNNVAAEILKHFPERKIFALHGEMGVGKTTLVKSFCKTLGVTEEAVSPTFSLVNEYKVQPHPKSFSILAPNSSSKERGIQRPFSLGEGARRADEAGEGLEYSDKIYHFDLYRLKNAEELLDIGFEEYLSDGAFCFIEWPELAEPFLPNDIVKLWLKWDGEGRIVKSF